MKKNLLIAVLIMIIIMQGCELKSMSNRCAKYEKYYQATEELLDEIAEENDSFLDTIGEGDNYCNYLDAREPLAF